jgi:CHAT domain-containing protein
MRSLRSTADLAETRSEVAAIAAALDAPRDAVRLGERASKAAILAAPLDRNRVIAFSTHALATAEAGALEPALVLGSGAARAGRSSPRRRSRRGT